MRVWTEKKTTVIGNQVAMLCTTFTEMMPTGAKVTSQELTLMQPAFHDETGYHPAESVSVWGYDAIKELALWLRGEEAEIIMRTEKDGGVDREAHQENKH